MGRYLDMIKRLKAERGDPNQPNQPNPPVNFPAFENYTICCYCSEGVFQYANPAWVQGNGLDAAPLCESHWKAHANRKETKDA